MTQIDLRIQTGTALNLKLSFQQAAAVVVVWMGMLMLPLAPVSNRFSGGAVLLFIAIALGTRNIAAIGITVALFNLASRFLFSVSSWHDQHWVQWSSISSLLAGHSLFATSPLYQFSLSSYMPMGDLFGGIFIALGIQQYWLPWHVLVVCLLALPVLLAPSFTTLLIFIGMCCFYPLNDYTAGGGTLEIGCAVTVAGIALFRAGRHRTASLVLFSFAAFVRQPAVIVVPFLALVLWQARDWKRIRIFAVLLAGFGGIYILADPPGAYHYLFGVWDGYHQELYNYSPGLQANYSISSIPHFFGVPDDVAWYRWRAVYLPLTLTAVAALFAIAWFRKAEEEILFLGVLATALVYVFSRGYAQYHYVFAAVLPLAAFLYPATPKPPAVSRVFANSLALVLLWIGLAPSALWACAIMVRATEAVHPPAAIQIASAYDLPPDAPALPMALIDGNDTNRHTFTLSHSAQFQLATPGYLSAIRLSGDHIPIQELKGVLMRYPTDLEMRGVITDGEIEGSEDGQNFTLLNHFHNSMSYSVWPVTLSLPNTPRPLLAVRLKAFRLYLDQKEWILGNVELRGRR